MNRRLFMRSTALVALAATVLVAMPGFAQTAAGVKRHRIVVQVNDDDLARWNMALNNVRNLQDDVGAKNVDVEIVAYGPGLNMLKLESPVASRIAEATRAGVRVIACENTMKAQKLTKDDLVSGLGYVPAGVTEIMVKQGEGWAYLRP